MITPVAVSARALDESLERPRRELNAAHEDLTEALLAHGILVFAGDEARRGFLKALRQLGALAPDALKRWEAVLSALDEHSRLQTWRPPISVSLENLAALDELRANWQDAVSVAVVDNECAQALGVPDEEWSKIDAESQIDIARAAAVWHCSTFRALRELALDGCFRRGTGREEIWESVLQPLVWRSRRIAIFDRYAASNVLRRHCDPDKEKYPVTALGWLLQRIDESEADEPVEIDLFSGDDGGTSLEQFEEALRAIWGGIPSERSVARIDLYLATWGRKPQLPHDRHIRFSLGCVTELPAGLDVFNKPRLSADASVFYRWLNAPLQKARAAEDAVRRHETTRRVTIS